MKIKYNIPKFSNVKEKLDNIKIKIKESKRYKNEKTKIPKKSYALLICMLILGLITLSHNMKEYNKTKTEYYTEYKIEDNKSSESIKNEKIIATNNEKIYLTAESSIYTTTENLVEEVEKQEETIKVISENTTTLKGNYTLPVTGKITKEYAMEKLV